MVPGFTHEDVVRDSMVSPVEVDDIHCSPFIHPGMDDEEIAVERLNISI